MEGVTQEKDLGVVIDIGFYHLGVVIDMGVFSSFDLVLINWYGVDVAQA